MAEAAYVEDYARMGRSARAEMQRERRIEGFIRWAGLVFPALRAASRGLVWEEGGRIVSAVLYTKLGLSGSRWTIDTVATHPDHQGKGLARRLLSHAVESIRELGGTVCTLKVREDNAAAYQLYRSAGFEHYDTTLHLKREAAPAPTSPGFAGCRVRPLTRGSWYALWHTRLDLAQRETPRPVQELMPVTAAQFRRGWFVRALAPLVLRLSAFAVHHWLLEKDGRVVATLAVRGDTTGNRTHEMDLSIDPVHEKALAGPLLDLGLATLCPYPRANILVETRAGNESLLAALQERAFAVMSTWHWLGRRLVPAGGARKMEGC